MYLLTFFFKLKNPPPPVLLKILKITFFLDLNDNLQNGKAKLSPSVY